jgi:NADPH-dependent 2,4-dienoyl-CoA reductase/sulfur reductase-like enzyme
MPLLKRRHRSWRGFADSLPLASRDDERPKKMKSHSQSSPMAKSILAVGALALLFAFPMLKKVSDTSIGKTLFVSSGIHTTSSYDAVIVGAGWSGIKAAETLLKGGVNNILVLEAHDYIGGR